MLGYVLFYSLKYQKHLVKITVSQHDVHGTESFKKEGLLLKHAVSRTLYYRQRW